MRLSVRIFLIALLLPVFCLGQSRAPDDSSTEENLYTNFFFRFHYSFTASWIVQPVAEAEQLPKTSQARLGDDAAKSEKHYYLLTLFRNLPGQGAAGRSRAVISMVADGVSSHGEIVTGKDYVLTLAERLKKSRYAPIGEPQEMHMGGQIFFRQDIKGTSSAGALVYQSAIFTVTRGYALGFMLVSPTPSLLKNMVDGLNTVQSF